ncbi:MAG: rRNA maturation RNase YbeY [Candidatus Caenarcaniphilales bacterium]|nr:rRNA maturation RNase YbeY [Candidatus Caenarcaniphilales bacterium]
MARVAISNRLNTPVIDHSGNKDLDLETVLPWQEIAKSTYLLTYKPYFSSHEVVLSFVHETEIKELNHLYRNINESTDVLSFNTIGNLNEDLEKFDDLQGASLDPEECSLGDIIICVSKAQKQAQEANRSLKDELHILFIHGLLHLLGFDHQSEEEAKEMFGLQNKIFSGNFKIQSLI